MKRAKIFAYPKLRPACLIAALAILSGAARAQVSPTVVAPVVVKVLNSASGSSTAPKGNWLKAEVIHIDANSIVVREQANGMMIHTFTYSEQLKTAMQKFLDAGGYQYGDKVKILFKPGQTVALRVLGKPSKPLSFPAKRFLNFTARA
jgi:hypothetical protein